MECYYDTLFECNCEGVRELRNVPCGYQYDALMFQMTRPGVIYRPFAYLDDVLFKRQEWIAKCGSYHSGYLHRFISLKSPITRYILETRWKFEWYQRAEGWWDYRVMPTVPSCYYLGTYPIYWNPDQKSVCYPDNLTGPNCYPLQNRPVIPVRVKGKTLAEAIRDLTKQGIEPWEFIPDLIRNEMKDVYNEFGLENILNYLNPARITKKLTLEEEAALREINSKIDKTMSGITLMYDKELLFDYFIQDDFLTARTKSFKECLARNYPTKPKEPTTTVPTIAGPAEFPGIPMDQLIKPTPEKSPIPRPGTGERLLNLVVTFGIKVTVPYNALDLETQLFERY